MILQPRNIRDLLYDRNLDFDLFINIKADEHVMLQHILELQHSGKTAVLTTLQGFPEIFLNARGHHVVTSDPSKIRSLGLTRPLEHSVERFAAIPFSTCSEDTVDFVSDSLLKCLSNHERCRFPQNESSTVENVSYRPTRLVDLTLLSSSGTVSVTDHGIQPEIRPYVTLSHRWGSKPSLQLMKHTRSFLADGFSFSTLPRLFQDACMITTKLGFSYIWIDSLCIIQDDERDWTREAMSMSSIYSASRLNIAAHSSDDSTNSLFVDRNPLADLHCIIKPLWEFMPATPFFFVRKTDRPFVTGTLFNRAWVLQERLLSPRTIHFTSSQLLWECRDGVITETGSPAPNRSYDRALKRHFDDVFVYPGGSGSLLRSWDEIVSVFCGMRTTEGHDKLMALMGVVEVMRQVSSGRLGSFFAGLWDYNIAAQLTWGIKNPGIWSAYFGVGTYRAPSWSWLAIDGEVSFYVLLEFPERERKKFLASILSVRVEGDTNDFQNMNHGCLILEGHLIHAELSGMTVQDGRPVLSIGEDEYTGVRWDIIVDVSQDDMEHRKLFVLPLWQMLENQNHQREPIAQPPGRVQRPDNWDYNPRRPGEGHIATQFDTRLKPKNWSPPENSPMYWHPGVYRIIGLILRLTGKKKGQFQRVGIFDYSDLPVEAILNLFHVIQTPMPSECYIASREPDRMYTVEIV